MKNVRRPHPPGASFHLKEKDVSHEPELCLFCVRFWLPGSVHTQVSVRQVLSTCRLPGSIGPGMVCGEKAGEDSAPALPSASAAWLLQTQQEAGQHAPLTFDALLSAPPGQGPHCPLTSPGFLPWPLSVPHQGEPHLPCSRPPSTAGLSTASPGRLRGVYADGSSSSSL